MPHIIGSENECESNMRISRRNILIGGATVLTAAVLPAMAVAASAKPEASASPNRTQTLPSDRTSHRMHVMHRVGNQCTEHRRRVERLQSCAGGAPVMKRRRPTSVQGDFGK